MNRKGRDAGADPLERFQSIVAVGGGAGPALVARALADRLEHLSAVVCTTDTGSSSGVCRRLFGMAAPGDLRATLSTFATLSGRAEAATLWEERLRCPDSQDLHGMALGNLVISALFQRREDFSKAVMEANRLLDLRGRVLPVTAESAQLEAELEDGTVVRGEMEIRRPGKSAIQRLSWADAPPAPAQGVLEAIRGADLILIGPGCLYTSLLPCLMVEEVAEAVGACRGLRVYICNTTTTPGQTDEFTVARHVRVVWQALGRLAPDVVLINGAEPPGEKRAAYESIGVSALLPTAQDYEEIGSMGVRPLTMPLLEEERSGPRMLHKTDTIRHDPQELRAALARLARS